MLFGWLVVAHFSSFQFISVHFRTCKWTDTFIKLIQMWLSMLIKVNEHLILPFLSVLIRFLHSKHDDVQLGHKWKYKTNRVRDKSYLWCFVIDKMIRKCYIRIYYVTDVLMSVHLIADEWINLYLNFSQVEHLDLAD